LFFSSVAGLRFDLQDEKVNTTDDAYFDKVVRRMEKIHAVATSPDDEF